MLLYNTFFAHPKLQLHVGFISVTCGTGLFEPEMPYMYISNKAVIHTYSVHTTLIVQQSSETQPQVFVDRTVHYQPPPPLSKFFL